MPHNQNYTKNALKNCLLFISQRDSIESASKYHSIPLPAVIIHIFVTLCGKSTYGISRKNV